MGRLELAEQSLLFVYILLGVVGVVGPSVSGGTPAPVDVVFYICMFG